MDDYIAIYCVLGTQKVGSQISMASITQFSLRVILATIQRIMGSASSHQISCVHMFYVVMCLYPTICDWCTTLLSCMKMHLTSCREGKTFNFGFGIIICSLFFERVPGLSP